MTKNNRQRATPQHVLMVESKEFFVIREFGSLTGTRPEIQESRKTLDWMRRGCSEHCPEAHFHAESAQLTMPAIARWTITGAAAATVLYNLAPYLMSDRGFPEITNEIIQSATLTGQGSGATLASLHRLVALGWELPDRFREELTGKQLELTA